MQNSSLNLPHIGKQIQTSVNVCFPQKINWFTVCTTSLCIHMDTVHLGQYEHPSPIWQYVAMQLC